MHPELQRALEKNFNMVQPEQVEDYRNKVTAIFAFAALPVDKALITSFPNLKVIGNSAVGYDHVDVSVCFKHGVCIGFTLNIFRTSTADMGWALLLATAQCVVEGNDISKTF